MHGITIVSFTNPVYPYNDGVYSETYLKNSTHYKDMTEKHFQQIVMNRLDSLKEAGYTVHISRFASLSEQDIKDTKQILGKEKGEVC